MLHPHTELRFVSPEIGYGVFATSFIPKGTITWVKDQLDRIITKEEIQSFTPPNLENLLRYTYRTPTGDYYFCWDLTRYVNHSFDPNSMLTPLGIEMAIRDIEEGEELTNDYGTLNIIEPFKCANHPVHEREFVYPDDLKTYYRQWDEQIESAFRFIEKVDQPLKIFLQPEQKKEISLIVNKKMPLPSILKNYYEGTP